MQQRKHVEAQVAQKRVLGAEHQAVFHLGRHAEAEQLQRDLHTLKERILGADHPDTQRLANELSDSLRLQGKLAEAFFWKR